MTTLSQSQAEGLGHKRRPGGGAQLISYKYTSACSSWPPPLDLLSSTFRCNKTEISDVP